MSTQRSITLNQPSTIIDESIRQHLVTAVNTAFEMTLPDGSEIGTPWSPPAATRADQLKAWLADHWLALEEDFVLLMPGNDVEPGVLNVNINGGDVFIGIASLESFKEAAEKLGEIPADISPIFHSAKAYSLPMWLCVS